MKKEFSFFFSIIKSSPSSSNVIYLPWICSSLSLSQFFLFNFGLIINSSFPINKLNKALFNLSIETSSVLQSIIIPIYSSGQKEKQDDTPGKLPL
jgi:hypothetical protein